MTLRRRIIATSFVLALALGAGLAWLAWDSVRQAREVERHANAVRAATGLAIRLGDAARVEERWVLSIRARAGATTVSEHDGADALDDLVAAASALPMAARVQGTWADYLVTRGVLAALRVELVAASRRGDRIGLDVAREKWRLMAARSDALLRNFTGYHLRALDRAVAELAARGTRALALAALGVALGVAVALGFAFALSRAVVRPMVAIASAAERVTRTGVLSPVAGAARRDEVGVLARAFNEMTERLVTANATLSAADRRKDEFLALLSHELRNPLAPIRSAVAVLEREPPGDHAARARAVIGRQVDHLARLVDDLLDATRISRGKIDLRRARLDLCEVARRAAEDHRGLFSSRGLELRCELPPRAIAVEGDETRLAQIAGNLLHNAAKFTPAGGHVRLSVAAVDGSAELRVEDDGAGIEPGLLPHVFEPFVQADSTLARSSGGLGLGLALVKGLAELHGGTAAATSAGPGKGAELVVRLPAAAGEAPRASADASAPPAGSRTVLVVDDNEDAAETLAALVELLGHRAVVAFDAPSALARARECRPEVVLCDIGLPGMSGYDFARAARSDPSLAGVRLVAVSGYAQPEDRRQAAEAGFDAHVAKPADPAVIERLLAR